MKITKEATATIFHLGEHLILGVFIGIISWWLTKKLWLGLVGIGFSIFIDIDHILEYFWFLEGRPSLNDFLTGSHFEEKRKIYLIFHGWEYVLISFFVWFFTRNQTFLAVALGMGGHLFLDQVCFASQRGFYFITYRAKLNFEIKRLFKE